MSEELKMYTMYVGDKPYKYRYGESWRATQLMVDGGYDTPEEAKAAWEAEQDDSKAFCLNCGKERNYHISRRLVKLKVRGVEFTAPQYESFCTGCGREVYVPSINDMNVELRLRYHKEATK